MVHIAFRYANRNMFPVIIPGKRGVGVTFASGQFSTDPWFSRFVGPRLLVKETISSDDPAIALPSPPLPASSPAHVQMLEEVPVVSAETDNWARRSGIYHCKRCDLFRTGSLVMMHRHLAQVHKIDSVTAEEEEPKPAEPKPVEKEEPAEPKPVEKEEPVIHACPHCDRKYKTSSGLEKHISRQHPVVVGSDPG